MPRESVLDCVESDLPYWLQFAESEAHTEKLHRGQDEKARETQEVVEDYNVR